MPLNVQPISDYDYGGFFSAMLGGAPKSGKTCCGLTLLKGAAGRVASKLIIVAFDEGSLQGPKRMAKDLGITDAMFVNMEREASGSISVQGKIMFCDALWSMQAELNKRARAGEFGPAPALWYASLTTMAEGIEREVRTCVPSGGRYDLYHMNPDKWNAVNATHANVRMQLSQWPGHKIVEGHLDPPVSEDATAKMTLTGKQKTGYPKQFAQLMELVVLPPVAGQKAARRFFETRSNGGWTRGVREGDETLDPQEPADWSVVASKLGIKMIEKKS